jgi:hypothetical protein
MTERFETITTSNNIGIELRKDKKEWVLVFSGFALNELFLELKKRGANVKVVSTVIVDLWPVKDDLEGAIARIIQLESANAININKDNTIPVIMNLYKQSDTLAKLVREFNKSLHQTFSDLTSKEVYLT